MEPAPILPMPATPMVEARNMSADQVNDMSFGVYANRVTAIIGLEQPMKTSLLRLLLGLERPDSGELMIGGRSCREYGYADLHTVVGVPPDRLPRRVAWSVQGYLRWRAFWLNVPTNRVESVIAITSLERERASRIARLTAGGELRFGLAVALLPNPQVLVLDNPFSGLGRELGAWMRDFLRRQAERGLAVLVISTFDLLEERTADDAVLIENGHVRAEGSVSQVRKTLHARQR